MIKNTIVGAAMDNTLQTLLFTQDRDIRLEAASTLYDRLQLPITQICVAYNLPGTYT